MLKTAILGYPRIGENRQLKKATEAYWKGEISRESLEEAARQIRRRNRQIQKEAGLDIIPSNDFSFYDQVLDMTALLGAVPERFGWKGGAVDLDTAFAMARGGTQAPAMEMTKFFDTNYHYLVPEFVKNQKFQIASEKPFLEFQEALSEGIRTRPVLIGPVTYLLLGKAKERGFSILDHLDRLVELYVEILKRFESLGADWVQTDEPALVLDLDARAKRAYEKAYAALARKIPGVSLMLTPYFGALGQNLKWAAGLPVAGIHLDLVRGAKELKSVLRVFPGETVFSLGIVDGRNVWKTDLAQAIALLRSIVKQKGEDRCQVASACSFLFSPLDLSSESAMDPQIKRWLSFARQKLAELVLIQKALSGRAGEVSKELSQNKADIQSRLRSPRIHRPQVRKRLRGIRPSQMRRQSPFKVREALQRQKLGLPLFPTTTIGSFPQTAAVRRARAEFKNKRLSQEEYNTFLKGEIQKAVRLQEEIGLDVLVHGEFERNDMVEHFGERLEGFVFTQNGWVQSYGSRYVKPPIIYGDVFRPDPMTVEWFSLAQSLTKKPLKGMLTGPITILQWSFVRDDQPRAETAKQIALAIRDEVLDLEKRGALVIQIDEPALREGLPLKKADRPAYLKWAVGCFQLASSPVQDQTQIHTHMCYGEFNDIIPSIAAMDADVISIETSRSQMELLEAFRKFKYPNPIGPGVYDVHSPRVATAEEMGRLLEKASSLLPAKNIWVNPDCGLKTRGWEETVPSLKAMVSAARAMRRRLTIR